jgi:hypothetical protein
VELLHRLDLLLLVLARGREVRRLHDRGPGGRRRGPRSARGLDEIAAQRERLDLLVRGLRGGPGELDIGLLLFLHHLRLPPLRRRAGVGHVDAHPRGLYRRLEHVDLGHELVGRDGAGLALRALQLRDLRRVARARVGDELALRGDEPKHRRGHAEDEDDRRDEGRANLLASRVLVHDRCLFWVLTMGSALQRSPVGGPVRRAHALIRRLLARR